jgi:hypothetical protein
VWSLAKAAQLLTRPSRPAHSTGRVTATLRRAAESLWPPLLRDARTKDRPPGTFLWVEDARTVWAAGGPHRKRPCSQWGRCCCALGHRGRTQDGRKSQRAGEPPGCCRPELCAPCRPPPSHLSRIGSETGMLDIARKAIRVSMTAGILCPASSRWSSGPAWPKASLSPARVERPTAERADFPEALVQADSPTVRSQGICATVRGSTLAALQSLAPANPT